jgi:hypothetical protein
VLEVLRIHDERAEMVGWRCTTTSKEKERLRAGDRVISMCNQSFDRCAHTREAATHFVAVNHGCRPVTLCIARNSNKRWIVEGKPVVDSFWRASEERPRADGTKRPKHLHRFTWLTDEGFEVCDRGGGEDNEDDDTATAAIGSGAGSSSKRRLMARDDNDDDVNWVARIQPFRAPTRPVLYGMLKTVAVGRKMNEVPGVKVPSGTRLKLERDVSEVMLSELREQHAVKVRIRVQKGGQTYVAVLAYVMRDSAQILLAKFLDNENKWALYCRARADGEDTDERHLNIEVELWGPDTTDALTWMKGLVDAVAWGHRGSSNKGVWRASSWLEARVSAPPRK